MLRTQKVKRMIRSRKKIQKMPKIIKHKILNHQEKIRKRQLKTQAKMQKRIVKIL